MINYEDLPDLYSDSLQYLPAVSASGVFDKMCRIVDRPDRLSRQWLLENRFVAVPIPENMEIEALERLAAVIKQRVLLPIFGACTVLENDNYFRRCTVEFSRVDVEALLAYERSFTTWDYLIFQQSGQLVVLQVEMGWHVIAGKKELVESVIGNSVEWARGIFSEHVAYYRDNYSSGYFAFLAQKLAEARDYYWSINDSILNLPDEGSESM